MTPEVLESLEVSSKEFRKAALSRVHEWFLRRVKEGRVPAVSTLRYVGDEASQVFVTPGCKTSINGVERWYVGPDDTDVLAKILLPKALHIELARNEDSRHYIVFHVGRR